MKALLEERDLAVGESTLHSISETAELLIQAHRGQPRLAERGLMKLLVVVKIFLKVSSFPHRNHLKQLLCSMDVVRRLPRPVGQLAH
jgi:hypothetical protein